MDTIIASEVFDHYDKTYLLDRFVGSGSVQVVRITETVHSGSRQGKYVVEVDASVISRIRDFIEAPLIQDAKGKPIAVKKPFRLTGEEKDKLVRNYLKGVTAEALAMQWSCKVHDIEQVLRQEGIEVVDQSPPPAPRSWRSWKRKK